MHTFRMIVSMAVGLVWLGYFVREHMRRRKGETMRDATMSALNPERPMTCLDGDVILLGAWNYLMHTYRPVNDRDVQDACDILVRAHVSISKAYDEALFR